MEQSLSNLNTAKANLSLAEITKTRYQGLLKKHAVSQQDVDNAVGTYDANRQSLKRTSQCQTASGPAVF